ncbi:MAG: deoxyguanosinetriphosphate triphosphohydrolase [Anaerolineaceae bacterium]|nr:deoxyguanosinetriphosphate triphosphohydrolase [Anaerolineaceae bacterium]
MLVNRNRLEQIESDTLAPYALLSQNSRGRQHHEHEPEYRTAFQRDRDRILHSAAFRRLEYKTQVFVNDEGDYYRTRLTHTLEVAQIGRTIARALAVNEDLVEAICLAHDLGHAPFGHAGETILNNLLEDGEGFNHNHQSYRIVTKLERRYPNWPGLNLTYETLEGIAKHETEYDLSNIAGFDGTTRGSLEAQIANVADELAYNAHDLDDALQASLFTPSALDELAIWRELRARLNWQGETLDEITRHHIIRELVGLEVSDVLAHTEQQLAAINAQSPMDVQRQPANIVGHSAPVAQMNRALKDFLREHMYRHFRVVRMAKRAEQFLDEIYKSYMDEPQQLPEDYQAMLEHMNRGRVVVDYIASMTDRSALLEYRRLFDPLTLP